MKTIALTLGIAALGLFGTAPTVEARGYNHNRGHVASHVHVSGHRSCGTPIYTERYLVGYDRRGFPVWGYRQVVHPPRRFVPAPCPPPRVIHPCGGPIVHRPYDHRTGIVIHGTIRR